MRLAALLIAVAIGACATMLIVKTGQSSRPAQGAPAADAQAVPAAAPTEAGPSEARSADAAPGAAAAGAAAAGAAAPAGAAPEGTTTAPRGAAATEAAPAPASGQQPRAGAQSPGSAIASVAKNARAVAASAAKSPATVASTLTQKPKAATAKKPPAPAPVGAAATAAAGPTVRIRPPQGLEGVAFGMSPQQISARYPPAWRRETKDELTLVYYPNRQGDQVRFHFTAKGLSQLELQLKPPQGEQLNPFYQRVKQQYAAVYGSLPGSADSGWHDGQISLQINYGPTEVSVCFTPKG